MTSTNFLFPEGNSINRPPIFNGDSYYYWKTCMQIFILAMDLDIWDAIENDLFVPKNSIRDQIIDKTRDRWSGDDKRRYNIT